MTAFSVCLFFSFVSFVTASCSDQTDDSLQIFATELVASIKSGTVSALPNTPQSETVDIATQSAEALGPLLEHGSLSEAPVTLGSVIETTNAQAEGSTARATLNWRWPIAQGTYWEYSTTADLYLQQIAGTEESTWAIDWKPNILIPSLAPGERPKISRVTPARAYINDGAGNPLVVNRAVWRIGIDKTFIAPEQHDIAARKLVELIDAAGYTFDPDNFAAKVAAAGERAFVELITLRQENSPVSRSQIEAISGARASESSRYLAPTATFARAILGTVGEATAEIIEGSNGRILKGDSTGLSGIQRYFDDQLSGTPGITVFAVNNFGDAPRELFTIPTIPGIPLDTTFDALAQIRAEEILANVVPASALVAIRPSTGEVIVAANGPGANGNIALLGQYPPGSTFKIVDALALTREGLMPDSNVVCDESLTVDGRNFRNVPGYPAAALGQVSFRTAFAHSCNTAMISEVMSRSSQAELLRAANDLGLAIESPLGIGAFFGSVPNQAGGTTFAANVLGQGQVEASPFAMARVAASVLAGQRVDPVFVRASTPSSVKPVASNFTAAEAAALQDLMASVVHEGSAQILRDIPGIQGAKTGTAQFGDGSQSHTWMVATIDNREVGGIDLAVAVFVSDGEFGATTSGPLMHEFLTYIAGR